MTNRRADSNGKLSLRLTNKHHGHPDGNRFKVTISGSADTRKLQRVREALYAESPRCHWCARVTVIVRGYEDPLRRSAATIDHIISRFHRNPKYDCEVVLACHGYNHDRAIKEHAELTPDEIHERSTRPPRCRDSGRDTCAHFSRKA